MCSGVGPVRFGLSNHSLGGAEGAAAAMSAAIFSPAFQLSGSASSQPLRLAMAVRRLLNFPYGIFGLARPYEETASPTSPQEAIGNRRPSGSTKSSSASFLRTSVLVTSGAA